MVQPRSWTPWLSGLAALLLAAPLAAQERGTVAGSATDAGNMRPLAGVQVIVEGTNLGAISNAEGRYLITGVPVGQQTVRAVLIGYEPVTSEVTVTADGTATLDFELNQSAIALDAVVVTASGEQRKREIGNAVSTIQADQVVETAPVNNLSDLLQGRSAGVQVMGSAGSPGMGSRIRIRGSSSISLSNEPLIYIDGVRVSNSTGLSVGTGGQEPSRLNDINPENIESIEIVKGPAAATLYGTEAANGVIRITTKRGRAGDTRWTVWAEAGAVSEPNDYPLNYRGVAADGSGCRLSQEAAGSCTQADVLSFQVLDDPVYSPIDTGLRQQYGASVSGGSESINFYVSAEWEDEEGPFTLPEPDRQDLLDRGLTIDETMERPQALERFNLQANLNAQLAENATLALKTGYVTQGISMTGNDNNSFGFLPSAYFGGADPDDPDGYWGFQAPAQLFGRDLTQDVERFTASGTGTWSPMTWLDTRATLGIDYTNRHDVSFFPRDLGVPGSANLGNKDSNFFNLYTYTVDMSGRAAFDLTESITSTTSVGAQYFRTLTTGTTAEGQDIVNGAESIGAAAETFSSESTAESKTAGIFVEQQIGLNDRLFLTGAVRADDNSAFGQDFDLIYYPKFSLSWIASEEPFWPRVGWLDQLRLRAAWGKSGLQPGSTAAIRTLAANPITDPEDNTVSGVSIGSIGNNLLEPEQSQEIELGFDADILGGRVGLELTYYDKDTEAALIEVPLAPSLGASNDRWVNIGEVENKGWEWLVSTVAVNTENVVVDLGFSGSLNENTLLDLGESEPIGSQTRFVEGFALGGQWARPIESYSDANGNGIIESSELVVGDTAVYFGAGMPEKQMSLTGSLTLFDRVRLYGLLDWRGDYVVYNNTERFRCRFLLCQGLMDRNASFEDQARATAAVLHPSQTVAGYLEDGSFWKLRELSASVFLPQSWAQAFRAERATVTVTGRNLGLWTDYTGIDPEVNSAGASDNFGTSDFLTQPPLRYWTVRFNFTF